MKRKDGSAWHQVVGGGPERDSSLQLQSPNLLLSVVLVKELGGGEGLGTGP